MADFRYWSTFADLCRALGEGAGRRRPAPCPGGLFATDRAPLEAAIAKTREKAKGEDLEAIRSAISELEQASHALSKILYESAPKPGEGAPGAETAGAAAGKSGGDDDAIDAEFEVKE